MQFLALLLLFSSLFAQEPALDLHFIQPLVNGSPGEVLTLQAEITNQSHERQLLVGHLDLPSSLEAMPTNNIVIQVEAGQKALQTFHVRPDTHIAPGRYPFSLRLFRQDNPGISATDQAAIIIGKEWKEGPCLLEMTSPFESMAKEGDLVFVTALVHNKTTSEIEVKSGLNIPLDWAVAPQKELSFSLASLESKLLLFGVKVGKGALAGKHLLSLFVKSASFCQEREMVVSIAPTLAIFGEIEGKPEETIPFMPVHLNARYTNESNVPIHVRIETTTDPLCSLVLEQEELMIPPHDTVEVPITITPESHEREHHQYVMIRLINLETNEPIYQNPMTLKFVRSPKRRDDPYIHIPAYCKTYVAQDRHKNLLGVELAGGGFTDEQQTEFLDFFFRIPTSENQIIFNLEERLYTGVYHPDWNLRLGDTVYNLTTLTQNYRYGRGAGVEKMTDRFQSGLHYTQNSLHCEQNPRELCSYFQVTPQENMAVSLNYLHKTEKWLPTSNIVTVQTNIELPKKVFTTIELGRNFLDHGRKRDNTAFRVESHGQLFSDSWFSFEKAYSGPSFYGYYHNLRLLTATLDFPIAPKWRLNLNYSKLRQNLSESPFSRSISQIPDQRQAQATMTFRYSPECSLSFNAMTLRARDLSLSSEYNFDQFWAGTILYYGKSDWSFTAIASFGEQKDYLTRKTTHNLQQYNLFLSRDITPKLRSTLFYDGGNINYYDARPWRNSFGAALSYRFHPRGRFDLFLQKAYYNCDNIDLSQISGSYIYTFDNLHTLQAVAQYFRYEHHYPNDLILLIGYTIPFDIPIKLRRDIGHVEGSLINDFNGLPVPGALLKCGGKCAETDGSGFFRIPSIQTGEKSLEMSYLPDGLIAESPEEIRLNIEGAKTEKLHLTSIPSASIRGEVIRYEYSDLFTLVDNPEKKELAAKESVASVRIAIFRASSKEIYTALTNHKGIFRFPKLRPGRWQVRMFLDKVGPLYEVEENDQIIDLEPGKDTIINFKVLPKSVQIYKLDS